jgi:gamma-glutamyltranspeptidase / glutathione hydrolase
MTPTRPQLAGTFGMVASTHWLATAAGMAELEQGGNAFDAAVAAGFALQVVEPHQNGPGGDLPLIFARAGDAAPTVLCGQGPAPAAATAAHYRDLGFDLVPGAGPLAAAVPGAVDAWLVLLRDHGTRRLGDVLDYALAYAERGHPLLRETADTIHGARRLFVEDWTTSAALYLPGGAPPEAGALFRNPVLGQTYRRLLLAEAAAAGGREAGIDAARCAWREGFVAAEIDAFARRPFRHPDEDPTGGPGGPDHQGDRGQYGDPDQQGDRDRRYPGVISGADVAAFTASYEPTVAHPFRDVVVHKTQAWGQGPVMLQQFALLDGFDDTDIDPSTVDGVHRVVEVAKLAFADREAWYGDALDTPLVALLSPEYTATRRALLGDAASMELRPGWPDGQPPRLPAILGSHGARRGAAGAAGAAGAPAGHGGTGHGGTGHGGTGHGDTCHLDVVDRWGNMVSATPSGGWLQSSPVIPALGFPLGSRLQMCWLEQGLPASLVPGRRPRTTLSPTLVYRDGAAAIACGTPGGDQQDQWQVVMLLSHLVRGLPLQEAIEAPSWHSNATPSSFHPRDACPGELALEARFGEAVADGLRRRGHRVVITDGWSLGRLTAVSRDQRTGLLHAAADPRAQGYAMGR